MSKKEKPYLLTQKLAAEIVARKKIRPDAPNIMPGDHGNGHVLVLDDEHQKFGGHVYTRRFHPQKQSLYYVCVFESRICYLHKEVWAFHNGNPPPNHCVHHEHRRSNGIFDSDTNDIEWLFLMTKSEHISYHHLADSYVKKNSSGTGSQTCMAKSDALQKMNFINPKINKQLEESIEFASDLFIDAGCDQHGNELETRFCFCCHRPFTTLANNTMIMCNRPDCIGHKLLSAISQAQNNIVQRIEKRNNECEAFITEEFGKLDVCVKDDGSRWFVGKQAAEMLGYVDTDQAIREHVEDADKKILKHKELLKLESDKKCEPMNSPVVKRGGRRRAIFINQFGFNDLIIHSKLPAAKRIQHWITHDVMPKLLVQGYYSFVEQPSVLTDYFVDEELLMLLLFRELMGGDVSLLADFNRLTDAERQIIVQLIKMLHARHQLEPPTLEAKPEQD